MNQTISVGRIVHYRLPNDKYAPNLERWRPAIVVQVFGKLANLKVFYDEVSDDERLRPDAFPTSRAEGEEVGNWRWPPRVD